MKNDMKEIIKQYRKLEELINIKAVEIFDVYITYFPQGGGTFITEILIQEDDGIYINWIVMIGYRCREERLRIPIDVFYGNWLKWVADQVNGEL